MATCEHILVSKLTASVQQFLDMDNAEVEAALHGSASHEAVHRIEGGKLEDASREHVVRVLEAAAGLH